MRVRNARLRTGVNPLAGAMLLALVLAGCGTPQTIAVRNIADATAGPSQPTPASAAATTAPMMTPMPGMEGHEGMMGQGPTPVPGSSGGQTAPQPGSTDFVLIWVLFGTPTPNATRPAGAGAQPTTAAVAQQPTSTVAPATQAAVGPTATTNTLPATATGRPATVGTGDPGRGQVIFGSIGTCTACHDVSSGITIVGPSLKGIASRAGTQKPGTSADAYLHESIVSPNAHVVQGFLPNLMPQNFSQILSTQQINDLVAYLMSLK